MSDQSELLERYLMMLRENPDAAPPPDLDAALATFARQMIQTPPANDALRARIWQRAVESQAQPNGTAPNNDYFDKETHPMLSVSIPKQRSSAIGWPLSAVVAAVCAITIWLLIQPPKSSVLSPAHLQTLQPTETVTATVTATITPSSTWTPTITALNDLPTPIPNWGAGTFVGPTVEITPAPFGSADGQIEGILSGANPDVRYHFMSTNEGVVAVSLSTRNLALVGLQNSVIHADNNGGGGGGGGGGGDSNNPLSVQSIGTHIIILPKDSVSIEVLSNTNGEGYSPDQPIPYTLDVRYMDVIDLGSKAFDGYTDNNLSDFSPLALYKFEANAGDIVTIRATGADGFDTGLELYDATLGPVGNLTAAFDADSGPGYDAEIYRQIMPATGTYYVAVTPGSAGYGSYRLQLTREIVPSLDDATQTARFNSQAKPRFMFTGHKDQTVTVNVSLPENALDYTVQSVDVTVEQDGKVIDIFNHSSALRLTQAGLVLSAPVILQSDSPVFVTVNANGKLTRPSQQEFQLEVSIIR